MDQQQRVISFRNLRMGDVERVGGKNASLGEMIGDLAGAGIRVPDGFATTAFAFREFLTHNGLADRIGDASSRARRRRRGGAREGRCRNPRLGCCGAFAAGARVRDRRGVRHGCRCCPGATWAVRSSATAEDLPDASFAGQQETFLNINGLDNILHAVKEVFSSLYNDRAISYRVHQGFVHEDVALSAGVQRMVRSDLGASGVMFTIDTESGFDQVVFITSAYGLARPSFRAP